MQRGNRKDATASVKREKRASESSSRVVNLDPGDRIVLQINFDIKLPIDVHRLISNS